MRLPVIFIIVIVTLVPAVAVGQEKVEEQSVFDNYLNPQQVPSFLHIPGLEFHSSVGFSYSSSDYGSYGMGYYLGHFDLQLSKSITLRWDVGIRSMMTGNDEYAKPEFYIPNIDLTYRPNDKFLLKFQYNQSRYSPYWVRRRY